VKGKPHKRRVHALRTEPYTVEESLRAAGMGSYRPPTKRKMETLTPSGIGKRPEELLDEAKKAKMAEDEDGDQKM